jgi:hypothetical protein
VCRIYLPHTFQPILDYCDTNNRVVLIPKELSSKDNQVKNYQLPYRGMGAHFDTHNLIF